MNQRSDAHGTATPRDETDRARLEAAMVELFEQRITFNRFLGFELEPRDGETARIGFRMRDELIGHYLHGRLHGGVIASVQDAVAIAGLGLNSG